MKKLFVLLALLSGNLVHAQGWLGNSPTSMFAQDASGSTVAIRVGIGITNPTARLHTKGEVRFEGLGNSIQNRLLVTDANGNVTYRDASSLSSLAWFLGGNNLTTGNEYIGTNNNFPFRIRTNGTEKAIISTNGLFGLGTSNPTHNIDVVTATGSSMYLGGNGITQASSLRMMGNRLWNGAASAIAFGGYAFIQATPNSFQPDAAWTAVGAIANPNGAIRVCRSGSDGLPISSFEITSERTLASGGVGINHPLNTLLTGVLDVNCNNTLANNTGLVRFRNVPNGVGQPLVIDANGYIRQGAAAPTNTDWMLTGNALTTGNEFLGTLNSFPLRFQTNGTEKAILTSSGLMGIGTSTPAHNLEVSSPTAASFLIGNQALTQSSSIRMIANRIWSAPANAGIAFGGYAFLQATPNSFVPDAAWTAAGAIANPNGAIRVCRSSSDGVPISSFEISSDRTLATGQLGVNLPLNAALTGVLDINCNATNAGLVRLRNLPNGAGQPLVVDANGYVRAGAAGGGGSNYTAGNGITIDANNQIHSTWTAVGNNIHNNNTGSVGIGITNPTAKLHIQDGVQQTTLQAVNTTVATSFPNSPIGISGKADASNGIGYGGTFDGANTGVYGEGESNLDLLLPNQSNSPIFDLKGVEAYANDLGATNNRWTMGVKSQSFTGSPNAQSIALYGFAQNLANSSNEWALYADGRTFTPGGVWTSSDARLKKNIEPLTDAMNIISKLDAKTYEFRKDGKFNSTTLPDGKNYGFLAQDLEKILPEAVTEVPLVFHDGENGHTNTEVYKAVNYTTLIRC
jgi:hypothetical protein